MAKNTDHLADGFEAENTGGVLSGFLAEEDEFDRRTLWRFGSWGVASVGALVLAVIVNQSSIGSRREQVAAADLARQAQQQIQSVAKESHSEARRLASAIETLNGDRDRLYTRVTVLEQGLDSVTGSIARQNTATAPPVPAWPTAETAAVPVSPPPVVAPVASTAAAVTDKPPTAMAAVEPAPATVSAVPQGAQNPPPASTSTPLMPAKSMMAPPDAAAGKLIEPEASKNAVTSAPMPEVASVAADAEPGAPEAAVAKLAVQRTEFGVDVGGANSVGGLRALWRGLLKSKSNAPLAALRPIIVVKEGSGGLGMQLRLVAGPLSDAAAAAKICAVMIENNRTCETTVFDGQRLALTGNERPAAAVKPAPRKRASPKRPVAAVEEPAKKPESSSTLTSMFTRRSQ
jgi:hypothetical protein